MTDKELIRLVWALDMAERDTRMSPRTLKAVREAREALAWESRQAPRRLPVAGCGCCLVGSRTP